MTHGVTYDKSYPDRKKYYVLICSKENFGPGPFILYPLIKDYNFVPSEKGREYLDNEIKVIQREIGYRIRYIARGKFIKIKNKKNNPSLFQWLNKEGYFDLWEPDQPLKYFGNSKDCYLGIMRVYCLQGEIPKSIITKHPKYRHRKKLVYELNDEIDVTISEPILSDLEFNKIEKTIIGIIENPNFESPESIAEDSLQTEQMIYGQPNDNNMLTSEGKKKIIQHVSYERNPKNRAKAIEIHGTICEACRFDFNKFYGEELARSYITVHHIEPLSSGEKKIDPKIDLIPLCPNCHSMIHRNKDRIITIEELKEIIEKNK